MSDILSQLRRSNECIDQKVTVRIAARHDCGYEYEQILHITADNAFDLVLWREPRRYSHVTFPSPFALFGACKHEITLKGHYHKVEVNGLEWRNNQILCPQCDKDLLFPEESHETT